MATRTFLALDLDEAVRRQLVAVQRELGVAGANVKWTRPSQLHVTMKFLGDVTDDDLPQVCAGAAEACAAVQPFDFSVEGVVCMPTRGHLRMVWVGICDPTASMAKLQCRLEDIVAAMGFRREHRRFQPHLTLGRVKGGRGVTELRQAVAIMSDRSFCSQSASELVIYASQLRPEGPVYVPLATAPLGSAQGLCREDARTDDPHPPSRKGASRQR